MKIKLTLALAAAITSTAFGTMPAHMPEFKNEKQLTEWRAEMAAKPAAKATTADPAFYTGKPYIDASGAYAFKYRSYNPEMARWTSEDPSGFPDGANDHCYINNKPTSKIDYEGLASQDVTINVDWTTLLGFSKSAVWHGIYTWSKVENAEVANIQDIGFTGDLPANGSYEDNNVGVKFTAKPFNRSGYNTKVENGVQWKQWNLDLQVEIWKTESAGSSSTIKVAESSRLIQIGHWYE